MWKGNEWRLAGVQRFEIHVVMTFHILSDTPGFISVTVL